MTRLLWLNALSWQGFPGRTGQGPVFRDLTWAIEAGERWAVVGPEGCGKSTLLRLMAGLLRPDGGEVQRNGQPCATLPDRAAWVGVLFADPALRFLTPVVWEEVALTPSFHGMTGERLQQRVSEALQWAGVPDHLHHCELATLSAAQSARVAWAAVWAMQPQLWLLDEPGAQLSEAGEEELAARLRPMTSVVFTSRMARARRFADRLVRLEEGTLRFE
ncbi:MAG: energy-coupling factor ABC transporter ATP-binding protein [Magnetococcus sp. DMHC-8]